MTIREYILEQTINYIKYRIDRLMEIGAPSVMIASCNEELERLENGELNISGDVELLDEEMKKHDIRTGRGGHKYHVFNGNINYFPKAKYGRFIAKGEVK